MGYPGQRLNRINRLFVSTRCIFFFGSLSRKNLHVKCAWIGAIWDGWLTRKFFSGAHDEDKVCTKDPCWSVGTIYDPRELWEVSTAGPGIGRGVTESGGGQGSQVSYQNQGDVHANCGVAWAQGSSALQRGITRSHLSTTWSKRICYAGPLVSGGTEELARAQRPTRWTHLSTPWSQLGHADVGVGWAAQKTGPITVLLFSFSFFILFLFPFFFPYF
jgi:hypothetical protein